MFDWWYRLFGDPGTMCFIVTTHYDKYKVKQHFIGDLSELDMDEMRSKVANYILMETGEHVVSVEYIGVVRE